MAVGTQTRRLYRGIGFKSKGRAHLASRNGKNSVERFPTITRALDSLPDETLMDGEIVAFDDDGTPIRDGG